MDEEKLEREAAKILFAASAGAEQEEVIRQEPEGPEIPFLCPFCEEEYLVSEELAGKTIKCRNCHEPCRVDANKPSPLNWMGRTFWIGFALGILLTVTVVLLLKILPLR